MANLFPFFRATQPRSSQTAAGGGVAASPQMSHIPPQAGAAGGLQGKKPRGRGGSTMTTVYGTREIKTYLVTSGELWQLFAIGLLASVSLSLGIWCFNLAIEIYKDVAFNPELPKELVDYWASVQRTCIWWGGGFAVIFILSLFGGGAAIRKIRNSTVF